VFAVRVPPNTRIQPMPPGGDQDRCDFEGRIQPDSFPDLAVRRS